VRSARAGQSVVGAQPADAAAQERALMALVACPTSSIGSVHKLDPRAAARRFPEEVAPGIYYCGWASADSYGASSWLIRRDGGNVLVDSPRASRVLIERLGALGGVRWMFLSHRDDVADHAFFHERLGCERVLHRRDLSPDTRGVERVIDGDEPVSLADDLLLLPVPGHTRGSTALLHGEALFTGDHLWADDDETGLDAGREVCWYSWAEQRRSMERLLAYSFRHVFPGHGRRFSTDSPAAMRRALETLLSRM
jgi:glyoxylase-like metal-dependent hydrolase (beta-lactamase superfamily II)